MGPETSSGRSTMTLITRYNKMLADFSEINAAEVPPAVKDAYTLVSLMSFLEADCSVLVDGLTVELIRPLMVKLINQMIAANSGDLDHCQ